MNSPRLLSCSTTLLLYCFFALLIFGSAAPATAFKLPDTGQTKCYRAVSPYDEIPCAGTGQDGAYNINPMLYTNNANGTVTDKNTGMMWQKCSVGQSNNSTCSGAAASFNWYQASGTYDKTYNPSTQDVCGSLTTGGYIDWRLPSKKELISIVNYSILSPGPTINKVFFPNTNASNYWSTTTAAGYDSGFAWLVDFNNGGASVAGPFFGVYDNYVRCVRGRQSEQTLVDYGNGTVKDNKTGLIWQQGEPGGMPQEDALSYCQRLSLGNHTDWRLPNVKELESLIDDSRSYPAIDTTFFPNAVMEYYCSSTTSSHYPDNAWIIGFHFGYVGFNYRHGYVRCVRGVQSGLIAPSALSALAASATQVSVSWTDKATKETGFDIERRLGLCSASNTPPWVQVATTPANTESYEDSGLRPNAKYSYRVKAYNTNGDSNYSKCAGVTTPGAALDFPTNLTAVSASAIAIKLAWNDYWTDETSFKIYRKNDTGAWTLLKTNPMNAVSVSDAGAVGNETATSYSYFIKACNSAGCSPVSKVAVVPYMPTNPGVTSSLGNIDLTWEDNSINEAGFQIYKKPGTCAAGGTWELVKTTASNTESYADTSVTMTQAYSYKVRAISKSANQPYAIGYSMFTNCVWTKVPIDG